jgi:hypothetical protein
MIIVEPITIDGIDFIRTYSDQNVLIERDGVMYSESIDPIGTNRTYTETDIPIDTPNDDEATDADYQSALQELGVTFDEEENIE